MIHHSTRPTRTAAPAGTIRVASIDVEWTKNYRIKNGNQAFCVSVVWLDIPDRGPSADLGNLTFQYASAYLEPGETSADLAAHADTVFRDALDDAHLITGHQLCSDLGVLAANATTPVPAITAARQQWKTRRTEKTPFTDTRFDADHLLSGKSRRLVDVCTELALDVTQPELRGTSMTALHRAWLNDGDDQARGRVSVLNLRHSLSTALVAARAEHLGTWEHLNVNTMLARQITGQWDWTTTPAFTQLLQGEP
ncbi:hypothetical protein [Streptacidiphilus monticola]|uniref:3'-5' exonuclease n=1 Tax=Streptacidiphilus monticola TaxID=2161674 RepID=A0ABW1GAH3_9ACTN